MHMPQLKKGVAAVITAMTLAPFTAHAVLERMGPIDTSPAVGGFPSWFQDKSGLTMEFCSLMNQSELTNGWCTLIPPGPVFPETFPNPFFIEHFYHDAVALAKDATTKARLMVAVEASFANGSQVIPGQQLTFGRIRVFITNVPFTGTYTVYHPFGKWTFNNVVAGDRIFFTEDTGLACVGTFTCTLGTSIGPFLLPSPTPGGAEVPPIPDLLPGQDPYYDILVNVGGAKPYPGTGKKYIADPGRIGPITGSPLPPFVGNDGVTYNHNILRVEGPNGWSITQSNFNTTGRIMTGTLPENVTVDRASYANPVAGSPTGIKLDVMATGTPTVNARLPGQPVPPATFPIVSFYEAPCVGTIDPNTGAVLPPFSAPVGVTQTTMVNADTKFWGQAHPAAVPASVCVVDQTSVNGAGQITPTYYNVPVVDEVAITSVAGSSGAVYSPQNGGSLTITANSTDTAVPAALTAAGYGPLVGGTLTVAPLAAPPATLTVNSSEGGSANLIVTTKVGVAGGGAAPVAVNDSYTMFEDCSSTPATSCAAPPTFAPLANDTLNGAPIPAGATVTIVTPPRLGTAVLNADNTITYTPNANANGIDGITYTVTYLGSTSNQAQMAITINPVADFPVAIDDNQGAVVGRANSVNVIANDTNPDGAAANTNAQIVSWPPQLGAQPVPTNGIVNFTPTSTGTFIFTYQTVSASGLVSQNTANATIVVSGSEVITIQKADFTAAGNFGGNLTQKWVVQGADNVKQGQTLTIVYNNGTLNAANGGGSCNGTATNPKCVLGTAVVDTTLGTYLLQKTQVPGGPTDPTDTTTWATKPSQVKVFSSSPVLGGSNSASITLR